MNLKFEVTHSHPIAVKQAARVAFADRLEVSVHVHAVAARIGQVIHATSEIDRGMATRNEAIGIGKNPVILQ